MNGHLHGPQALSIDSVTESLFRYHRSCLSERQWQTTQIGYHAISVSHGFEFRSRTHVCNRLVLAKGFYGYGSSKAAQLLVCRCNNNMRLASRRNILSDSFSIDCVI